MSPPWCSWSLMCAILLVLNAQVLAAQDRRYVVAGYLSESGLLTTSVSSYVIGLSSALSYNHVAADVSYSALVGYADKSSGFGMYAFFALDSSAVAFFGPGGRALISDIILSVGDVAFACFSPFAQTQAARPSFSAYQDQVYWTLPSTQAQGVGLLHHLSLRDLYPLQQLVTRSNGFASVGESLLQLMLAAAPALGLTKMSKTSYEKGYTVRIIARSNIRILYQSTRADDDAPGAITELISSSVLIDLNTSLATTVELAYMTLELFKTAAASGEVLPPENIIISMPVPGIDSTEYVASQEFVQQASGHLNSLTLVEKMLMMAGWASGRALLHAMNMYRGELLTEKTTFYNNLLAAQSSFLVSDLYIGSFGSSNCPAATAISQGAVCKCHAGGNNMWFHSLVKIGMSYDITSLPEGLFQYGLGLCANLRADGDDNFAAPNTMHQLLELPRTVHLVGMSPSDNVMLSSVCSQVHRTMHRLANTTLYWHRSNHAVRGYCKQTTMRTASEDVKAHEETYVTTSLMGVVPDGILTSAAPTTLILDFMPQTTQSHISKANYVYLFPTLEQELSVLAYYLSGVVTDASTVCGVVRRSATSDATASLVRSTLVYFGMDVSAEHLQQPADDLGASIPVGCTHTVVIGMAEGDASGLLAYLKGHSTGVLLVSFDDVTKLYASIYTSFLGEESSVTDRLVFATNLPTWTGPTVSASEVSQAAWLSTVPEFVQTLPPLEQTPAAARTFIVAMVYDLLTRGTRWGHSDLLAALYGNVTVRAGGMTFGPFTTTWGGRRQIVKNYGAQDIAVWSYTRVKEPSTELLAPPRTLWLAIDAVAAAAASTSRLPVNVAEYVTLLEQGGRASSSEEDCVELQASSSKLEGQTVILKSGGSASPTTNATSSSSHETADASTDSTALWSLLYAVAALLMLVLLYIVLLLLMWTGSWSWAVRRASSVLWRGKKSSIATPQSAAARIRARLDLEALQDRELQRKARDSSRAPHDCSGFLTVVYVEVEKWRPLWVRQSRVMSRAVRHYHRCVRHAITEHECYEMESVEGIFVVVCPSASVGVQFGRDVVANVARLTKRDADILAAEYSNFGYRGGSVAGLRVRVAVHMGSAEQRADMGGRVRWSGAAIDDAVCAAHVAGSAGFIVFTESVAQEVKDVEGQSSLGFHLLGCRGTEELFCQQVLPLASNSSDGKPQRGETDVSIALATLSGATDGLLKAMCAAQLEAHYAGICEEERIADLQCLCHLSGVSHASHDSCSDRHCYYLALRDGMSSHLAALSDCHHGVSRAERIRAHASTANGTVTEENPLGQRSGSRFFGRTSRNTLRRTSKRRLVHFAYARGEDDA